MYAECLQILNSEGRDETVTEYDIVNSKDLHDYCADYTPDINELDEKMHEREKESYKQINDEYHKFRDQVNGHGHVDINTFENNNHQLLMVKSSGRPLVRSQHLHSGAYKRRIARRRDHL